MGTTMTKDMESRIKKTSNIVKTLYKKGVDKEHGKYVCMELYFKNNSKINIMKTMELINEVSNYPHINIQFSEKKIVERVWYSFKHGKEIKKIMRHTKGLFENGNGKSYKN